MACLKSSSEVRASIARSGKVSCPSTRARTPRRDVLWSSVPRIPQARLISMRVSISFRPGPTGGDTAGARGGGAGSPKP
eukprot:6594039-Alexandrium_andersonii.AAC.1